MSYQLVNFNSIITNIYSKIKSLFQRVRGLEASVTALESAPPVADGNGVYDGDGEIPEGTLASIATVNAPNEMDFAIGQFPNWPDMTQSDVESGLFISPNYWGGNGFVNGKTFVNVYSNAITMKTMDSSGVAFGFLDLRTAYLTMQFQTGAAFRITSGAGSPQGVVSAPPGSIYINTSGGAGQTLWVKESTSGSSGWVAK